ncbi:MAG: nitrous oxide-stimulated promoter family protein [Bacteroidales bacterium]
MNPEDKRKKEKLIVRQMIQLYCKQKHHTKEGLCSNCRKLLRYAYKKSDICPFMQKKTFCSNCKAHCYEPIMRRNIKIVMRFAGARMILYQPLTTLKYLLLQCLEKLDFRK